MTERTAWGWSLTTIARDDSVLDAWFPAPELGAPGGGRAPDSVAAGAGADPDLRIERRSELVTIDLDAPPTSTQDVYLRLHLLSHRLAAPNTVQLDGIFGLLPIALWTARGPLRPEDFATARTELRRTGTAVHGPDRFPRMTDYVLPSRVRIADAARVRLGAHLAPGTTVMHEGFVNYNAGTLGASMVEGRISQGVVVGDGSDIGGGASIMGTLSGGGAHRVAVGRRSLIGANAGVGISLGDDCIVEAGLYVTAGTKVRLLVPDATPATVKAAELSGTDGLLFRRNSLTGAVEALPRTGDAFRLNAALHA